MVIEGEWGLMFEDDGEEGGNVARLTLRGGVVFEGGLEVGVYEAKADALFVVMGDGQFAGRLPGLSEHSISGTFTSAGPDGVSDPAMLVRAVEQPAVH